MTEKDNDEQGNDKAKTEKVIKIDMEEKVIKIDMGDNLKEFLEDYGVPLALVLIILALAISC